MGCELRSELTSTCIEQVFNGLFADAYSTRLVGSATEPYFEVKPDTSTIFYCYDYAASALHEAAHWCLASTERRKLDDYGYWYEGQRDLTAQKRFESVEVRPQAIEWIFSVASNLPFRVSVDNLELNDYDTEPFRRAVQRTVLVELDSGMAKRARQFAEALARASGANGYDRLEAYSELPS